MIDWTQLTEEAFNAEVQRIAQASGFSVAEVKSWAGLKRMGYDDGTPVVDAEPHVLSDSRQLYDHSIKAVLDPYNPVGSTHHVNFTTSSFSELPSRQCASRSDCGARRKPF